MAWKQVKQFETYVNEAGFVYFSVDNCRPVECTAGTTVRVTYEVQEPKYKATKCEAGINCWELFGPSPFRRHYADNYPGGPRVAAEAEAARLNALEDAS